MDTIYKCMTDFDERYETARTNVRAHLKAVIDGSASGAEIMDGFVHDGISIEIAIFIERDDI